MKKKIQEAKDLVIISWAKKAYEDFNREYTATGDEEYIDLCHRLNVSYYVPVMTAAFDYEHYVTFDPPGPFKELADYYHAQLREERYRFNNMLNSTYRFENTPFSTATVFVDGKEDDSEDFETWYEGKVVGYTSDKYRIIFENE